MLDKNIKFLRKKRNMSQDDLADKLGYKSFTTIQKWESGVSDPPFQTLKKIADIFNVDMNSLANEDLTINNNDITKKKSKGIKIPVLGKVIAGIPVEAIEDIIDYEEITEEMAMKGEYFGLQIKGDSMKPRIQEGDIVIVQKQEDAESGDTAIILVNGHDATCKKIKKTEQGIMLIPNNPAYEPIFYTNSEISSLPVTIIGKVVELRAKF